MSPQTNIKKKANWEKALLTLLPIQSIEDQTLSELESNELNSVVNFSDDQVDKIEYPKRKNNFQGRIGFQQKPFVQENCYRSDQKESLSGTNDLFQKEQSTLETRNSDSISMEETENYQKFKFLVNMNICLQSDLQKEKFNNLDNEKIFIIQNNYHKSEYDKQLTIKANKQRNKEQERKYVYNLILQYLEATIERHIKNIYPVRVRLINKYNKKILHTQKIKNQLSSLLYKGDLKDQNFTIKNIKYLLQSKQAKQKIKNFLQSRKCDQKFRMINIKKYIQTSRTFEELIKKEGFEQAMTKLKTKPQMFSKVPWSMMRFQQAKQSFIEDFFND